MFNFIQINKLLLPMKGQYLFLNSGTAVISFLPVYAKHLGFSGVAVGVIYTIMPIACVFAKPIFGAIADKFNCRKLVLLLLQTVVALSLIGALFLSTPPEETEVRLFCNRNGGVVDVCDDGASSSRLCDVTCPIKNVNATYGTDKDREIFVAQIVTNKTQSDHNHNCAQYPLTNELYCQKDQTSITCSLKCTERKRTNEENNESFLESKEYWFLLITYLVLFVSFAICSSVSDTICFQLLGDEPFKYGRQRMFGAFGWGIFSIINGLLLSAFSSSSGEDNFTPLFIVGSVFTLVGVVVAYTIKHKQEKLPSLNLAANIFRLLKRIRICIFIVYCIFVGICTAFLWSFLLWHLEDLAESHPNPEIKSQISMIQGFAVGVQCLLGEVPFFFLSSWILQRLGHVHVMNIVLLAIGVRYILYAVMTNPWWAVPVAIFNGPTYGLFYSTVTSYGSIIAPAGTETTVQGVVTALFEGVGIALGGLLGGIFIDNYGGAYTYGIGGIAALVMCVLHAIVQWVIKRSEKLQNGINA